MLQYWNVEKECVWRERVNIITEEPLCKRISESRLYFDHATLFVRMQSLLKPRFTLVKNRNSKNIDHIWGVTGREHSSNLLQNIINLSRYKKNVR